MAMNLKKSPNAAKVKEVSLKGKETANVKAIADLDVTEIDENPDNSLVFNMNDIDRLMKTIQNEGFHGAIEVFKKEDGRYEVSAGHRRLRAVKELGWTTIPAIITAKPDNDVLERMRLVSSNINNRVMTPMDWARAIRYTIETYQLRKERGDASLKTNQDILEAVAEYFGKSVSYIKRMDYLNDLIPELQELIFKEIVPWGEFGFNYSVDGQKQILKEIQSILDDMPEGEPKVLSSFQAKVISEKYRVANDKGLKARENKRAKKQYNPAQESVLAVGGGIEPVSQEDIFDISEVAPAADSLVIYDDEDEQDKALSEKVDPVSSKKAENKKENILKEEEPLPEPVPQINYETGEALALVGNINRIAAMDKSKISDEVRKDLVKAMKTFIEKLS